MGSGVFDTRQKSPVFVESGRRGARKNPSIKYHVVVHANGKLTCSCLAGWHRRPCRHVRAVQP